jgi:hypothetical protein
MIDDKENLDDSTSNNISVVLGAIVIIIALYFAYKCVKPTSLSSINQNGWMNIIAALCCSPCYIAYRLAVPC